MLLTPAQIKPKRVVWIETELLLFFLFLFLPGRKVPESDARNVCLSLFLTLCFDLFPFCCSVSLCLALFHRFSFSVRVCCVCLCLSQSLSLCLSVSVFVGRCLLLCVRSFCLCCSLFHRFSFSVSVSLSLSLSHCVCLCQCLSVVFDLSAALSFSVSVSLSVSLSLSLSHSLCVSVFVGRCLSLYVRSFCYSLSLTLFLRFSLVCLTVSVTRSLSVCVRLGSLCVSVCLSHYCLSQVSKIVWKFYAIDDRHVSSSFSSLNY